MIFPSTQWILQPLPHAAILILHWPSWCLAYATQLNKGCRDHAWQQPVLHRLPELTISVPYLSKAMTCRHSKVHSAFAFALDRHVFEDSNCSLSFFLAPSTLSLSLAILCGAEFCKRIGA